jgi:tRNA (adenine57-N1/adenine58-N1)-methyltransferase
MAKNKVGKKETIVLIDSNFKRYFIDTDANTDKVKGVGVIDPSCFIGKRYGEKIEIGNKNFYLLKPSLMDKLKGLKRKAQIILPKELAYIVMFCSIESGDTVLEAGIGSGSLTIALANAIAPDGKVISYDKREDFIKHAKKNLKKSRFLDYVETKHKDITKAIDEKNLDSIIIDIPNPWDAINHSFNSLKIGGYLCCYSPLISQVEKTVKEIKKHNFIEITTFENIQREMIVSDHGTRPSFNMLGHTGYLTFARKVL